jgi:hypothetical protein
MQFSLASPSTSKQGSARMHSNAGNCGEERWKQNKEGAGLSCVWQTRIIRLNNNKRPNMKEFTYDSHLKVPILETDYTLWKWIIRLQNRNFWLQICIAWNWMRIPFSDCLSIRLLHWGLQARHAVGGKGSALMDRSYSESILEFIKSNDADALEARFEQERRERENCSCALKSLMMHPMQLSLASPSTSAVALNCAICF